MPTHARAHLHSRAGRIEVSRALGDRAFKRQGLSATPDVQAFVVGPRDEFMLLACDGFFSVFNPQARG